MRRHDPQSLPNGLNIRFVTLVAVSCAITLSAGSMGFWTLARLDGPAYEYRAAAALIALAFVATITAVQYQLRFFFLSRSLGCRPPGSSFEDTLVEIDKIAARMGIRDLKVLISDRMGQDFLAINTSTHNVLVAGSAAPLLLKKKRIDTFRFIVSHEMAHFKNKDIFYGYISIYIRRSLTIVLLLIAFLSLANLFHFHMTKFYDVWAQIFSYAIKSGDLRNIALNIRILASNNLFPIMLYAFNCFVFLMLIHIDIQESLRYREHLADIEASKYCNPNSARDSFPQVNCKQSIIIWLKNLTSPHPLQRDRLEAVAFPSHFMREGFLVWVLLGGLYIYIMRMVLIGVDLEYVQRITKIVDVFALKYRPGFAASLHYIFECFALAAFQFSIASRIYTNTIIDLSSITSSRLYLYRYIGYGVAFCISGIAFLGIGNSYVIISVIEGDKNYILEPIINFSIAIISFSLMIFILGFISLFLLRFTLRKMNDELFVRIRSWWLRAMMTIFFSTGATIAMILLSFDGDTVQGLSSALMIVSIIELLIALTIMLILALRQGKDSLLYIRT